MSETDYGDFECAFGRISVACGQRWTRDKNGEIVRTYFTLLQRWPLTRVVEAFHTCAQTLTSFPKPAQIVAVLEAPPRRQAPVARHMSVTEQQAQARAAAMGYEDDPCHCVDCVLAGVSSTPPRFVPTLDGDTEERAYNPRRNQMEVVGHWAHGEELKRWYAARDAFQQTAARYPRVRRLLREREPGEEG